MRVKNADFRFRIAGLVGMERFVGAFPTEGEILCL